MSSLLNREEALERVGGDEELLAEIARIFLDDYPTLIAEIRAALARQDAQGIEHAAHSLKGSVANFGAAAAWQAALDVEAIGRSRDLARAASAFTTLEAAFAELKPELEKLAG